MVLHNYNAGNCMRCGKDSLVTDSSTGEKFCSGCGFVIQDRIVDLGSETRAFTKEEYD
ncbi:MAG: transcription initiation factor IIB, partial [Thaumarchaeota archaeon]|nr:transcription initiation factor IIB [Nitrososphaerota archaeon]